MFKARFYVNKIEDGRDSAAVTFQAVSRGNHNAVWSHFTPAGSITMTINNEALVEKLREVLKDKDQHPEFEVTFDRVTEFAEVSDGHAFVEPPPLPENSYFEGRCVECGAKEDEHVSGS